MARAYRHSQSTKIKLFLLLWNSAWKPSDPQIRLRRASGAEDARVI